jgi:hypothetical protein
LDYDEESACFFLETLVHFVIVNKKHAAELWPIARDTLAKILGSGTEPTMLIERAGMSRASSKGVAQTS